MPVQWENNGEPVNGEYRARITFGDGRAPQVFHGPTHKDVADALLNAQENASNAIYTLKQGRTPEPAKVRRRAEPRPLTSGDRMQVAVDINNPAKAPEAITRVMESIVGPVEVVREAINRLDDDEEAREAGQAAEQFRAEAPGWYPSQHNLHTMMNYMRTQSIAPTVANFHLAFDELSSAGLLQQRPPDVEQEEPEPVERRPPQPAHTRPRGTLTTSIRASDTSGSRPAPRPKYTKADIEKMSRATYRQKLDGEPGFKEAIDSLYKSGS